MWIFYAILSALFAALVAIFGKIGLKNIDPIFGTAVRAFFMFGFVAIASVLSGKINFSSINKQSLSYIILGGVAGALSWIFYFIALRQGDATKVSAIDRMSVVFVVILAALFSLEKITFLKIGGALLMFTGALLIGL